jgi:hypothetical protein
VVRTDGTAAGTMVIDLVPGPVSLPLFTLHEAGGKILFTRQPFAGPFAGTWVTSGDPAALMLTQLAPISDPFPTTFDLHGNVLVQPLPGATGSEPYGLDFGATCCPLAPGCTLVGPAGETPRLRTSSPYLGRMWYLSGEASAPSAALILAGLPDPGILGSHGPCSPALLPLSVWVVGIQIANRAWAMQLPIPNDQSLGGARFAMQWVQIEPNGTVRLSDAWLEIPGRH